VIRVLHALGTLVVALAAIGLAVIFAASVSADATLFGGAPDLVCVVVVSIALLRGPELGAVAGFGAGLALDALTWQPLGLAALVYCLVGYLAGTLGERLSDTAPLSPLVVVAISSLFARIGLAVLGFLLGSALSVQEGFSLGALPSAALDVLLAIPLYALLRRGLRAPPPPAPPLPHMSVPPTLSEPDDVPAILA
jgi:rod shape-determining protein MreD